MRVKLEYGDSAGRGDITIEKTEIVETNNFYHLYCHLKKEYIKRWNLKGDPNNSAEDYLNEFSEIDEEEEGAFYIGFEEGEYIEGWILI